MKPRITVITIGVDDLERSLRFYRDGLGFQTQGIIGTEFEHGAVAFFDLQASLKLSIWSRTSISHDSGIPIGSSSPTEFTLGHNVSSKAEVEAAYQEWQNRKKLEAIDNALKEIQAILLKFEKIKVESEGETEDEST